MELITRKWSREEYQRMIEVGLLREDERVELIKGDIIALTPVDPLHSNTIVQVNMLLTGTFGSTHAVRSQVPVAIGTDSEPEPDFSLISLETAHQLTRDRKHPSMAELVIEVSNTSLAYDRGPKGSLYASGQIPLYWVVNLVQEVLEVYTAPAPDATAPFGWSYAQFQRMARGQVVCFADRALQVDDFLPPS
jgi:Uma2 family endonuclease